MQAKLLLYNSISRTFSRRLDHREASSLSSEAEMELTLFPGASLWWPANSRSVSIAQVSLGGEVVRWFLFAISPRALN